MAVLQMQRISIYALRKNRKPILEWIQRCGAVEINDVLEEDSVFRRIDMTAQKTQFEKNIAASKQALDVLHQYMPEKKSLFASLEGRKEIPAEQYDAFREKSDSVLHVVHRLNELSKDIADSQGTIQKLQTQIEALNPWVNLDVSMRIQGTKCTASFVGTLPTAYTEPVLEENLALLVPKVPLHVDVISTSQEQTCIFLLCNRRDAPAVEEALRTLGFAKPASPSKTPPAERMQTLQGRIEEQQKTMQEAEEEIKSYAPQRDDLKFMVDYLTMRQEKYEVIGRLMQSRRTFVLTGYIPQRDAGKLAQELEQRFGAAVELENPSEDEDVPVLLKNNKFTEPVEGVLESFSLPGKGEVDPTSVMAVFYYFLFGMMLSDAAYGLLMVIGCGLVLLKFKNMEDGLRKTLRMFFFCGISTTVWGFLFGSFFGDALAVVSRTFFGNEVALQPLWFEPLKEPMRMLMFALLVGVIHLFTGLAMQLYQLCRQKKYKDALYDVIFWYMLVGGAVVFMLSNQMFVDIAQLSFILPAQVGTVAAIVAGIGAVGIIFTSGRESRNPIKRLLKGLYGLYNVTGYLSDVLSYSRLLALGLATSVIATVINQMGSMGGGGVGGAIMFILVFLVGHTINLGINLLGAYVHTNRLQFVEFFGKFYEGGGRKFAPFGVHTKYYKIREEK